MLVIFPCFADHIYFYLFILQPIFEKHCNALFMLFITFSATACGIQRCRLMIVQRSIEICFTKFLSITS
ncbi:hypothetical protein VNO80_11956 [Phaseolus coccineus]|uniref:Uncharacterized protein n=1 Tax=Phaseolus coccineus TaxID=3886 RepID=A0AAN9NHF6_PHACN